MSPEAWAALLPALAAAGLVATAPAPPAFSAMAPGGEIRGWQLQTVRGRPPASFALVTDGDGATVLEAAADGAVAALATELSVDPQQFPVLRWRWKVANLLAASDLRRRDGDDYPARVYVMFDYDPARLPLATRLRLRLARWLYGRQVPAAALCYVWDTRAPPGTVVPNAYTDRVRMIVLRNADDGAGQWRAERRDVAADFRAAFGEAPPPVSGVAVATDTDDTGEQARAWFGDLAFTAD